MIVFTMNVQRINLIKKKKNQKLSALVLIFLIKLDLTKPASELTLMLVVILGESVQFNEGLLSICCV